MWLLFIATAADITLLYYRRHISAYRQIADRLSNGDDNQIRLRVESNCPFGLRLNIIDEIPFVFQRRDISFRLRLAAREAKTVVYSLRPTRRGVLRFRTHPRVRLVAAQPRGAPLHVRQAHGHEGLSILSHAPQV